MIISFFGQMASAKDTAADYLNDRLKEAGLFQWKRASFANAVKNVFCQSFGVDRQFIEDWKRRSDCPPNMLMPVRQALQFIGDGFRKIQSDIWIDIALREDNLILSDGRYLNEARAVREKGGINIVLYRPGFVNDDPNPSEAQIKPVADFCHRMMNDGAFAIHETIYDSYQEDVSNVELFDFFIRNDGSLQDFYDKIDNLLVPYIREKSS